MSWKCNLLAILALTAVVTSCASTKTVNVWKDESSNRRMGKVLVIAVAQLDFMQKHFENVLSERLAAHGIEAVAANRVFPQSGAKLKKEDIVSRVRELGVANVLVSRVVGKEEAANLYQGGVYVVPTEFYGGWYGQSFGFVPVSGSSYDAEFFTLVTNIYEVSGEKLIWSSLSRVKVENSRQGAINPLIDLLVKQMEKSRLF
jgi:hypothetical protein